MAKGSKRPNFKSSGGQKGNGYSDRVGDVKKKKKGKKGSNPFANLVKGKK